MIMAHNSKALSRNSIGVTGKGNREGKANKARGSCVRELAISFETAEFK
jgi:hypothetical protein